MVFFHFPNQRVKLRASDHLQSAGGECILTCDITYFGAMVCVSFLSKSEAINVFPKHILKSNARDQSIEAKNKLFCHVIVKNYLCIV